MKSGILGLALILLVIPGPPAGAQDRVEVGVVFDVRAQHFTDGFDATEEAAFVAKGGEAIVRSLDRHIKFVRFTNNIAAAYKLRVLLANPEKKDAPGTVSGFGFHLELVGPDAPRTAKSYVEFRPKDRFYEPVGGVDALAREIEEVIENLDYRAFVANFLSEIQIADKAEFRKDQESWVIEGDRLSLCIGYDSLLRVRSQFAFGTQTRREWFPAKVVDIASESRIFAETRGLPGSNIELLQDVDETKVKVERVAVADYYLCQAPVPASEVTFPEAGGGQ